MGRSGNLGREGSFMRPRTIGRPLAVALILGLFAAPAMAVEPAASERDTALSAGKVPVDEYNDAVKDKKSGDGTPVRGGTLRVRLPAEPESFNDITSSDATSRGINKYIFEGLIDRDVENFERVPGLAKGWEIRDLVDLKDGKTLDGRLLEETAEEIKFAPGVGSFRTGRVDVKAYDAAKGTVELKDGRKFEGQIKEHEWTIEVERKPTEVLTLKKSELKPRRDEVGGKEVLHLVRKNCSFTFEAREGVTWHDGVPFTIDDAIFTLDIINNPAVDCASLRNYYKDIEKYEKVGKNAIKFTYARPYYRALSFCGGFPIFPRHRYQVEKYKDDPKGLGEYFNKHPDNESPIGTGPYRFEKWEKGKSVTLVRNDKYWASSAGLPYWKAEQPYLDRLQYIVINNKAAALKELQNGKIDCDFDVEQDTWQKEETNSPEFTGKFARAKHLTPMVTYIGWNGERAFFKDKNVRRAMTMLVDRARILKEIHNNLGLEVTGPEFIYGPGYDASLKPLPYDPKAAKKLLREAGWVDHDGDGVIDKDGVKFEFTYLIHNARDYHQKIADIVKESIEQAGIIVNIKKIDWQVFSDHVQDHKFDAVRYAVSSPDPLEPDPYQIWHSTQMKNRGSNFVSYSNPRVDEILERGRMTFNDEERWKMYNEFHRIVYDEQPWTTLYCFYELYFYNKRCRGVRLYKIGTTAYNLAEWYIPKELQ
jgi:peptide/nickel transport system substrate-binding protein